MTASVEAEDARFIAELVYRRAGLVLTDDKTYLLDSRLSPLARQLGFQSVAHLVSRMRQAASESIHVSVVEALTTNETSFFRDIYPFKYLQDVMLPALLKARASTRRIRIWSAAASTGQEAYSILFTLDSLGATFRDWSIELIGTDLSRGVIDRAKNGQYSQFEVQRGLPVQMLIKYFNQNDQGWQVKSEIRRRVKFLTLNLLEDKKHLGVFDILFIRNILIYFDNTTKSRLIRELHQMLANDGFLILGGTESMLSFSSMFAPQPFCHGAYRLVNQ